MAIVRTNMTSASELVSILDGLGWFKSVEDDGTIKCYVDNDGEDHLLIDIPWNTSQYTGTLYFRPVLGSTSIYLSQSCIAPRVCWQTKNGVLLVSSVPPSSSNAIFLIIGKTNNGKIAIAVGTGNSEAQSSGLGSIRTCAEGENDGLINSPLTFRTGIWNGYTQLATFPVPTHPATGQSYIKGAYCLPVAPSITPGIITIGGVEYATNGSIALSDEE